MDFDMNNLMQQAQAMQEKMQKMQEEIANAEVTGEAGAGMVKVTMNGRHDVRRVELDPSLMNEDKEMLEDRLAAAVPDGSGGWRVLSGDEIGIEKLAAVVKNGVDSSDAAIQERVVLALLKTGQGDDARDHGSFGIVVH